MILFHATSTAEERTSKASPHNVIAVMHKNTRVKTRCSD